MEISETSVSERLTQLVAHFEKGNKAAFARTIGITPQGVGDLLKGASGGPSFTVLQNILMKYPGVNQEWLIFGRGPMLNPMDSADKVEAATKALLNTGERTSAIYMMDEPENHLHPGQLKRFLEERVVVVDQQGNTIAPIVNYSVAANYLSGYQTQEYFEHLDTLSLPPMLVKGGRHMVFPVIGDSMYPTFNAKDYVLCREVQKGDWEYINDFTVCVVVSETYGLQLKRVKVRPREGFIRCKSDNRQHRSYNIELNEVLEIWRFEWRLTACADNVTENVFMKVDNLEDSVQDLRILVEGLMDKKELQRLLDLKSTKGE